jgi:hypothetical protein
VYDGLAARARSLMARGIYSWAARRE